MNYYEYKSPPQSIPQTKKATNPNTQYKLISLTIIIVIFSLLYLWSIRPIWHTEFYNLTRHSIQETQPCWFLTTMPGIALHI